MNRPWVKVCGVTREEDAQLAAELGATHLGLNFWPGSPRYLSLDRAMDLVQAVRGQTGGDEVAVVGVFVDADADEIRRRDEALGLDLIQLHGDEAPETASRWPGRVLKAFRRGAAVEAAELDAWGDAWGFLFDVRHAGSYGGTGKSWSYRDLRDLAPLQGPESKPVFVAGGITPENARTALEASGADGLDLASGVEQAPGIKDPERLRALFSALAEPALAGTTPARRPPSGASRKAS